MLRLPWRLQAKVGEQAAPLVNQRRRPRLPVERIAHRDERHQSPTSGALAADR
jgi:hypothetical protein